VVARLRSELSGPIAVGRSITPLSVSLGATTLETFTDASEAIERADKAMYADKALRRRVTDRA
jgi:GGDEF domain-containing protein